MCVNDASAYSGSRKYSPIEQANMSADLNKTLETADAAILKNLTDSRALWLKGECLRLQGKPMMALPLLERAVATSLQSGLSKSDRSLIYESLGLCLESIGRAPQAVAAFRSAISASPKLPETHYMQALLNVWDGQQAGALKEFDLYIAQSKSSNAYISKARYLDQIGKLDDAISLLRNAEKIFPKLSFINEELAFLYVEKGNPEQAEKEADVAAHKRPQTANSYGEISRLYKSQRKIAQSLAAQKKQADITPSFASLITLANSYRDRGQIEEAAKVFDKAEILYPESSEPLDRKAKMYRMYGRWKEAFQAYNRQIQKGGPSVDGAYGGRGECYEHMGEYKKAIADFDVFLSKSKKRRELLSRAKCLIAVKDYKHALDDANYWLSTHPSHITATEVRAKAYLGLGREQDAVRDLDLLIKFSPEQTEFLRLRGEALKKMGRFAEANADFTKAKTLSGANK